MFFTKICFRERGEHDFDYIFRNPRTQVHPQKQYWVPCPDFGINYGEIDLVNVTIVPQFFKGKPYYPNVLHKYILCEMFLAYIRNVIQV